MIQQFANMVHERSEGRLVVNVFPESQLGNDHEVMTQIRQDAIGLTSMFTANMTHVVPEMALFDLPYLFFSMEQAEAALNGTLGDHLTSVMAEHDLVNFGFLTSGFKHLTNNVRPINYVTDMDGLRMRVSQSHFLIAQFQAINAGGISIPFGELYDAFVAGLADGQENPLPTIIAANLHNVQNYLTISNHGIIAYPIFMSAGTYNSLPEDLRQIIRETFEEIQPLQWQMIEDSFADNLAYLYTTDININYLGDAAMQGFRAAMQVVYDEFAEMPGGAEMLALAARYTN
jgi:C4-dicarboxylate-binding protein DctP